MKRCRTCHSKALSSLAVSAGLLRGRAAGKATVIAMALAGCFSANIPAGSAAEVPKVDFTRDVRPILANHCFKCHGPDEGARKAKLRLDVRAEAVKSAKSGESPIVSGRPEKSELVARIF